MTRPKLSDKIRKKENINFPVTTKQKEELGKRAKEVDLTLSEYLRQILFPFKEGGLIKIGKKSSVEI